MTPIRLTDRDIRPKLHGWLEQHLGGDPSTVILEEFRLSRPSGRVDVAVVNGELAAFEIKSDADSLARLARQVRSFSKAFEKIAVVTTSRHHLAARDSIPSWWGIILVQQSHAGEIEFLSRRQSRRNPDVDGRALLHVLTFSELRSATAALKIKHLRPARKAELIEQLLRRLPLRTIKSLTRSTLKARSQNGH